MYEAFGVYVIVPFVLTVAVPFNGCVVITGLLNVPSISASLLLTFITTGVFSPVFALSSIASGLSLIGLIFNRTQALSHNIGIPLSQTRYINESTPWKFGLGLNVIVPLGLITTVPLFG